MKSEVFIVMMSFFAILFVATAVHLASIEKSFQDSEAARVAALDDLEDANYRIDKLNKRQQPPLIILDEASGFTFERNEATISLPFARALKDEIIPMIEEMAKNNRCDSVELTGFTDNQAYCKEAYYRKLLDNEKKLDDLLYCLEARDDCLSRYVAKSNFDLGILRAIAVMNFLQNAQEEGRLKMIKFFRPFSGGSLVLPGGRLAPAHDRSDEPQRRRIEIRLVRSADLYKE